MRIESLNILGGKIYEPFMDHVRSKRDQIDIFCFQEVLNDAIIDKSRILHDAVMDIYSHLTKALPNHRGYFAPSQDDEEGLCIFIRKDIPVINTGDVFVYRWK